jgi:hypothetical protein
MRESRRICAPFVTKNEGEPDRVRPRMAAAMTFAAEIYRSRLCLASPLPRMSSPASEMPVTDECGEVVLQEMAKQMKSLQIRKLGPSDEDGVRKRRVGGR